MEQLSQPMRILTSDVTANLLRHEFDVELRRDNMPQVYKFSWASCQITDQSLLTSKLHVGLFTFYILDEWTGDGNVLGDS